MVVVVVGDDDPDVGEDEEEKEKKTGDDDLRHPFHSKVSTKSEHRRRSLLLPHLHRGDLWESRFKREGTKNKGGD